MITPVVPADQTIFILVGWYHRYILWVITPVILANYSIFILVSQYHICMVYLINIHIV
jgi:hypothetical protein